MTTIETMDDGRRTTEEPVVHRLSSIARALRSATAVLQATDSPRLTAEALLAHVLGLTRAQLLARPGQLLLEADQAGKGGLV